jgi:endonuclease YncB( thermonuclease family)
MALLFGGVGLFAGLIWHAAGPDSSPQASTQMSVATPTPAAAPDEPSDPAPRSQWRAPAPRPLELPYARATSHLRDEASRDKAEPETASTPEPRRFPHIIAEDTGTLKSGEVTIRLAGIAPLGLDRRCGEGDAAWPCGRVGRSAVRRLIRGRTIACTELTETGAGTFTGRCTVAGTDIGEWLVRYGWARPTEPAAAEPYREALALARREGRGQWRATRAASVSP